MPGGRPPVPTRVLELRGTYRKDRHGDPADQPDVEIVEELPPPPGFLDDVATMEWNRVGPDLVKNQLLATVDLAAFTLYCLNISRVVACERLIAREGMIVLTPFGQQQAHPGVAMARQCGAEARKFAQEFGMTPSARRRVTVPTKPKAKDDDPWGRVKSGSG